MNHLTAFIRKVQAHHGKHLTPQQADLLTGQANLILSCV